MLKATIIACAALSAAGCTAFHSNVAYAPADERAAETPGPSYSGPVTPASLRADAAKTSTQPVGLVPCRAREFPARNCWRRGDQHIVFPDAMPDSVDGSALVATAGD